MTIDNNIARIAEVGPRQLRWLSAIVAVAANVALFYVLALARTVPVSPTDSEYEMIRTISIDLSEPIEPEKEVADPSTDIIQARSEEMVAVSAESAADIAPSPLPRLRDLIGDMSAEAAALPLVLPTASDLRGGDAAAASGLGDRFSVFNVDRMPSKITGAFPRYPQWARQRGLEAIVTLRFVVSVEGTVQEIKIHEIEGDERFGGEAARAIGKWRFKPAIKNGRPVACWCFQKINFKLVH